MKKLYYLLTILLASVLTFSFISCSDDDDNDGNTGNFLISKIVYDAAHNGGENHTFEYNDKRQIIKAIESEDGYTSTRTYEYNTNGTPKKIIGKSIEEDNNNREENWETVFEYTDNKVTLKTTGDREREEYEVIHFDNKGFLANYIESGYNGEADTYFSNQYKFDSKGNLTSYDYIESDENGNAVENGQKNKEIYESDDKNNPFINVVAPAWFKSFLSSEVFMGANNRVKSTGIYKQNGEEPSAPEVTTIVYTYNANNFPTKCIATSTSDDEGEGADTADFEYIEFK